MLLPLLLLPPFATGKIMTGQLQLTSAVTEQFMTKFAFSPSRKGHLSGSFGGHGKRFKGEPGTGSPRHKLELALFSDEAWPKYLEAVKKGSLCSERMELASSRRELGAPKEAYDKAKRKAGKPVAEFSLDEDFAPRERSHYYYFVLADCTLEFYPAHPPTLDYELHLLNGKGELPADEDGMVMVNLLALMCLGAALVFAVGGLQGQLKRFGQCHLSAVAVSAALALQFVAVLCELIHLMAFATDGKGMRWRHGRLPLDFWSDTLQNLSELVAVVVVLSVGSGWTLVDGTFREMKKVGAAAAGGAGFQFLMEMLGRRYQEDFSSFHDHDHWPGKLLMLLRCACCGAVAVGTKRALKKVGGTNDASASTFLKRFFCAACVW